MVSCVHALISGQVQGVGYRYSTKVQAQALGLVGWVRNLPDGRVEAMIQGDAAKVEAMIQWLHQGPPAAWVDAVVITEPPLEPFEQFEIRR